MSTANVTEIHRRSLASIDPATGELLRLYEQHPQEVIDQKLQLASETFQEYRNTSFIQRARMMSHAAETLEKGKDTLARLMTEEMGKLLHAAMLLPGFCLTFERGR